MTVTARPLKTTLSAAEQQELRRYMKEPDQLLGVDLNESKGNIRLQLVRALASKGYLSYQYGMAGFAYYRLSDYAKEKSVRPDQLAL